jgi:hypothetical protein
MTKLTPKQISRLTRMPLADAERVVEEAEQEVDRALPHRWRDLDPSFQRTRRRALPVDPGRRLSPEQIARWKAENGMP